jgi:hypothetical protein
MLTEAFTFVLVAGDCAVLPWAAGCCAVVPLFPVPLWFCWAWPAFAGAGLADCCVDGVDVEGAVWACPEPVWPEVFCEAVELVLGLVDPADWLEGAELPLAGEFC